MIRGQDVLLIEPSPFHERAAELCRTNAWVRAGRLTLVEVYSAVEEEYWALQADAGLYDLSYLRSYRIQGPEALLGVEHLITGRLAQHKAGELMTTLWCSDAGAVIGHGTVLKESEDAVQIITREPCKAWIEDTLSDFECRVGELTFDQARLGLAGPTGQMVLEAMGLSLARQLQPGQFITGSLRGLELGLMRRGPERFELWTGKAGARVLWDRLMSAGKPLGLKPVGTEAANLLRLQAGEPALGVDFISALTARVAAEMVRPEALGLETLIERSKRGFVGQTALEQLIPPPRRLLRLIAQTTESLKGGIIAGKDQRPVGYLTSSGYAPALGASLAYGWVETADGPGSPQTAPQGLVLPPDAGSGGKLRQIACRLA
jgi:glycine cleavage system aminomethyltransferase T